MRLGLMVLLALGCAKEEKPVVEAPPRSLVEHADRLGRRITDQGARSLLIADLGAALVRAGRAEEARPYLTDAETVAATLPDPIDRESVLASLANAQALMGEIDRAKATAAKIGARDTRSETLADITKQLAARRDFAGARTLIAAIPDPDWQGAAGVHLVAGLLAAKQLDEAGKTAARISVPARRDEAISLVAIAQFEAGNRKLGENALNGVASPHWRAEAAAATAKLAYQRGARRKAIEGAKGIESHWIRARTYAELSGMAARAGRNGESKQLLEQSIEFAEDIKDQVMKATALTDVAMRLIDRDRLDDAQAVLLKAPPTATRHKADAHLVAHLAKKGEMERAYLGLEQLEVDAIWGSEAASSIARAHASRGEFTQALEVAGKIRTRELRLPALAEIAVMHAVSGAPIDAALMEQLEQALFSGEL